MKLETKHKEIIWCIILTLGLILFFATGCKPKQIIQERIITKVDSAAIYSLQEQILSKNLSIENLQRELSKTREENSRLQEFIYKHEINYDTNLPVIPETGKPPVSSEVITESKRFLENTIKELGTINLEYRNEINSLSLKNSNLELTVEALKEENRILKEKTIPTGGSKFRSFLWGIVIGAVLLLVVLILIKKWV